MDFNELRTEEYDGYILLSNYRFEEPRAIYVTIHVDECKRKWFELFAKAREMLIEEFIKAYGEAKLDDLLNILDKIGRCTFTIVAYDYYPEEKVRVSTRNLSVVADRCSNAISDLSLLIVKAESKEVKNTNHFSMVSLCSIGYINLVLHALNRVSRALSTQCDENALLKKMANTN